jgi:hypothetical protein
VSLLLAVPNPVQFRARMARAEDTGAIVRIMDCASTYGAKAVDGLNEFWINAMLFGPKTKLSMRPRRR